MAIRRSEATIDVVEAAKRRIQNVFRNGLPVYESFSGGKDSLCLAQLTVELIQQGLINPEQLTVQFIDEEAIFPCIERTVKEWRRKFMLLGAKFEWYCLEVRHFNCFNELSNDESFICWDRTKQDVWVRQPPSFAIRSHPLLYAREETYQQFIHRACSDGIAITGVRTTESVQRVNTFARSMQLNQQISGNGQIFPIYDWGNNDVWLYLKEQRVDIPEIYLYLWQSGLTKNQLRVSQFFSVDTARSLVKMNEYYPDLMERVIRREPNAYLAALYWDSEMFGRTTRARRDLESGEPPRDYKAELLKLFSDMPRNFPSEHKLFIANHYRNFFLKIHNIATPREFKRLYEGLISGDPKMRSLRAMFSVVFARYRAEEEKRDKENG